MPKKQAEVQDGWMPRKDRDSLEKPKGLKRLTGTLRPRFSAGYELGLSNLPTPPKRGWRP